MNARLSYFLKILPVYLIAGSAIIWIGKETGQIIERHNARKAQAEALKKINDEMERVKKEIARQKEGFDQRDAEIEKTKPVIPDFDPHFGDRQPDQPDISYIQGKTGTKLIIRSVNARNFYIKLWRQTAQKNHPLTANKKFSDWEERRLEHYLAEAEKLKTEMPDSCENALWLCPNGIPFVAKANDLNSRYLASPNLRLWQLKHLERAYLAILMDKDIRTAVHVWKQLPRDKKIPIVNKIIAYCFSAYGDYTYGHALPKSEIVKNLGKVHAGEIHNFHEGVGLFADADSGSNTIRFDEYNFNTNLIIELMDTIFHETRHMVSKIVVNRASIGGVIDKKDSIVEKDGIFTELKIAAVNNFYLYSDVMRQDTGDKTVDSQAEEAGAIWEGLFGRIVAKRLLMIPANADISLEQAQEYFNQDFYNPARPFGFMARMENVHAAFLGQWIAGGEICYTQNYRLRCERPLDTPAVTSRGAAPH